MPVLQEEVHRWIFVASVEAPPKQVATVYNLFPVGLPGTDLNPRPFSILVVRRLGFHFA
jgi:hypothetical protein